MVERWLEWEASKTAFLRREEERRRERFVCCWRSARPRTSLTFRSLAGCAGSAQGSGSVSQASAAVCFVKSSDQLADEEMKRDLPSTVREEEEDNMHCDDGLGAMEKRYQSSASARVATATSSKEHSPTKLELKGWCDFDSLQTKGATQPAVQAWFRQLFTKTSDDDEVKGLIDQEATLRLNGRVFFSKIIVKLVALEQADARTW